MKTGAEQGRPVGVRVETITPFLAADGDLT
jgi:hypothetical protein